MQVHDIEDAISRYDGQIVEPYISEGSIVLEARFMVDATSLIDGSVIGRKYPVRTYMFWSLDAATSFLADVWDAVDVYRIYPIHEADAFEYSGMDRIIREKIEARS